MTVINITGTREQRIGAAYRIAEDAWQEYRRNTGDHSNGILNPLNNPQKEHIVEYWNNFFGLYDSFKADNPPPKGMAWGIYLNPDRPQLYKVEAVPNEEALI